MKTNSNSYTIIYSAVLVLVVAFLLAFVFQALKPMQDANVQLDQQKQILFALNQDRDMTDAQAVNSGRRSSSPTTSSTPAARSSRQDGRVAWRPASGSTARMPRPDGSPCTAAR